MSAIAGMILLQAITVRRNSHKKDYFLISYGERRFRAVCLLGYPTIAAVIDDNFDPDIARSGFPSTARLSSGVAIGTLVLMIRACALVLFMVMSMAEPLLAVALSGLAVGCFLVAVLFGSIFHAHFPHRWLVLGASVVSLLVYVLYRF